MALPLHHSFLLLLLLVSFVFESTEAAAPYSCLRKNPECHLQGKCFQNGSSSFCACDVGFGGPYCEDVDRCEPNPCYNSAACKNYLGNFYCLCTSQYHGPLCEHRFGGNKSTGHDERDFWLTAVDSNSIVGTAGEKVEMILNIAKRFATVLNVELKIYLDSRGKPMIYDWISGERLQVDAELPAAAQEFTKSYDLSVHHTVYDAESVNFFANRQYATMQLPTYLLYSNQNPNWAKRISLYVHYSNANCLRPRADDEQNEDEDPDCPTDYAAALNSINSHWWQRNWHRSSRFHVTVRSNAPHCSRPNELLRLAGWLFSLIATFVGTIWATPRVPALQQLFPFVHEKNGEELESVQVPMSSVEVESPPGRQQPQQQSAEDSEQGFSNLLFEQNPFE
ncbi:hypothetical protein M3Y99_00894800 [Aphelenchoides fujianensis]|nr:hypothetical protein M3Y99_00894800 [Aphelenchoides fujianensis]